MINALVLYISAMMMFGAALYIYGVAVRDTNETPVEIACVTIASASSFLYFVMGTIALSGRDWHFVRYIDWGITTPLLIFALLYLCKLKSPSIKMYAHLVIVDWLVILCAYISIRADGPLQYILPVTGFVGMFYIFIRLVGELRKGCGNNLIQSVYNTLLVLTAIIWGLYPLVWAISPSYLALIDRPGDLFAYSFLDLFAKVFLNIAILKSLPIIKANPTK